MSLFLTGTRDHALVAAVIQEARTVADADDVPVSRAAVQRSVYFLKALKVPMRYQFDWHAHGAFTDELAIDLDWLLADEVIVDRSPEPKRYTDYAPGAAIDELLSRHRKHITAARPRIRAVLGALAPFHQDRLDLISALDYDYRWVKASGPGPWKPRALERFHQVRKAPFLPGDASQAYDALAAIGLFDP